MSTTNPTNTSSSSVVGVESVAATTTATTSLKTSLWGGRFRGSPSACMHAFNRSIMFDKRLALVDIRGSQAYAKALHRAGLLSDDEEQHMQIGLTSVAAEWTQKTFVISEDDEDIHSANERRLQELIGTTALKLHTGRSRNDQVATDFRMFAMEGLENLEAQLCKVLMSMATLAERKLDVLMPAYTHLQRAQPIRFSQWLLSHAWPLRRDLHRVQQALLNTAVLPLGSGACAGNPFAIDRETLAADLGFVGGVSSNSLDGVSDRDFVTDFLYLASMIQLHLSRFAEDVILYCSAEYSFLVVADAFSTGSSLMPQKRNPDALELLRGKSGRVTGSLMTLQVTLKGLPIAYKDMQEDKEPFFDAFDTVSMSLEIAKGVLGTLQIQQQHMKAALAVEMLSTDVGYYLVNKGVAFRQAHHLSGQVVKLAEESGCSIAELSLTQLQSISSLFEDSDEVRQLWSFENSVEQYQAQGGTSRKAVLAQIEQLKSIIH